MTVVVIVNWTDPRRRALGHLAAGAGVHAIQAAQLDAGGLPPQILVAGNMLAPILSREAHLGTLIADFAGLNGIEAMTVESAGASGGAALRTGLLAIASGQAEVALVVGVEKFTDQIGAATDAALCGPSARVATRRLNRPRTRTPTSAAGSASGSGPTRPMRAASSNGGSVKPDNILVLRAQPDVDGALVSGASLDPRQFFDIVTGGLGGRG